MMTEVIPPSFRGIYADLESVLEVGRFYIEDRLKAELRHLNPVVIAARVKNVQSAYSKMQKGDYSGLRSIEDLIAARAVFLHPSTVAAAVEAILPLFPIVEIRNVDKQRPTDFAYSQPHIIIKLPPEYVSRNRELEGISIELQFTTYIQHALQESVHDVIYKGRRFSWREHRLDARLRGLLEIADDVLEHLPNVASVGDEPAFGVFDRRNEIIDVCLEIWGEKRLPKDLRRFAITVDDWLRSSGINPPELRDMASQHPEIVDALSLGAVDKILCLLLLEKFEELAKGLKGKRIVISPELESFVPNLNQFPANKKIQLQ
jgi:ppGpp synthetase/RelA/SpoT-type nucleotidyltranferase